MAAMMTSNAVVRFAFALIGEGMSYEVQESVLERDHQSVPCQVWLIFQYKAFFGINITQLLTATLFYRE